MVEPPRAPIDHTQPIEPAESSGGPVKRYIGTFHKTGTILFKSILTQARAGNVLSPWLFNEEVEPVRWDVCFDYHSHNILKTFDPDPDRSRYVFSVRDPRDLIVSATYYHARSEEAWLHRPTEKFGGMTYQQKLLSYPDIQDRFRFEMDNSSGGQIRGMLRLPLKAQSATITRFEHLMLDHDLMEFHRIFAFLRFETETILGLLALAYENSIFSGRVSNPGHIRSGESRQWVQEFSGATLARYDEIFGNAAEVLGYTAEDA